MKTHVLGLAKIAAAMANGGSLKGVKVIGFKKKLLTIEGP